MGLFGSNDDEDNDLSHRGGFNEKDDFEHSGAKYCTRIIDEEAEIVLYGVGSRGQEFTLTAVPLKDTALDLPDESEHPEGQEE